MAEQADKIQWHPGFCSAAELELIENKTELEFIREYNLGKEPLRIDLLVIKKRPGAVIKNEIGSIFKEHNLVEYKSPDDGLSIDDYYKAAGYACIYKSLGETVNAIPAGEVTVSFFREAYPRELVKQLKAQGLKVEERYPGIYHIKGNVLFATQVVVIQELHKHSGLKILSKNAQEEDIRRFLEEVSRYTEQGDKNNADAVLQVSVLANQEIYKAIRRDLGMCEALKDLMKDEIDKEVEMRTEKIVQEAEKTKKNTIQSNLTNLMENTGWTREKAMQMLGISPAE
ncbi:MAG: hypothetical protein K2N87_12835 [Eubacterium sp.]|nr:hypothetical protein [Eubacterium sp.]